MKIQAKSKRISSPKTNRRKLKLQSMDSMQIGEER